MNTHAFDDDEFRTQLFELGKAGLARQGLSRHLGAELTRLQPGSAELRLRLGDHLLQQNGFAHGGAISFLVDNALTFAGGSVLGVNVLTQEYKVSFCRPGIGDSLIARASVIHSSKRQAVCHCHVFAVDGDEEKLCATSLGSVVLADRR